MVSEKKNSMDMTSGPLFRNIVVFFVPLMISNLLQTLYNAADMMVVSLSPEADAVGAIGTTAALINLIVNIFVGFATGATVVIARHLGAGEEKEAAKTVHTALIMSVIFGVGGGLIGLLFAPVILGWMGVEGRLLELAVLYTRIYFVGVPFVSVTNYAMGILRAKGDTKTPLYVLSATGLLNVALNLFFVLALDFSVEGVALATALSNVASSALLIGKLMREGGPCRFVFSRLHIDRKAFGEILYIGLPSGISSALFSISNILIQSSVLQVNNLVAGADVAFQPVVKGNSTAQNLAAFGHTSINAVSQAAISFTGQNIGAKRIDRVCRVRWYCIGISVTLALVMGIAVCALHEPLFALYGVIKGAEGSLEQIAFDSALTRTKIIMLSLFTAAFMEMNSGVAKGAGKAVSSTVITLVGTCLLRVVWAFVVLRVSPTLGNILICYPITWVLTGAALFISVTLHLRKLQRQQREAAALLSPETV